MVAVDMFVCMERIRLGQCMCAVVSLCVRGATIALAAQTINPYISLPFTRSTEYTGIRMGAYYVYDHLFVYCIHIRLSMVLRLN